MQNSKSIIIEMAKNFFPRYGIKSISMVDLAFHCGMSKKIIYTHFENKEEVVNEVVRNVFSPVNAFIAEQELNLLDARVEMKKMFNLIEDIEHFLTPKLFYDLKKYQPDSFRIIIDFLNNKLVLFIKKNMQKGMQEKMYDSLFNKEIVSSIYAWQLLQIFEEASILKFRRHLFMSHINNLFLSSILIKRI